MTYFPMGSILQFQCSFSPHVYFGGQKTKSGKEVRRCLTLTNQRFQVGVGLAGLDQSP
jgi:hypothetical protein